VALDYVIPRAGSAAGTFGVQTIVGSATASSNDAKCFTVTAGGYLKATLVWTDAAGSAAAGEALVNDLNLLAWRESDGFEWRGNNAAGFDSINSVESIYVTSAQGGLYGVSVFGASVQASQAYSLVVTGTFTMATCGAASKCALLCNGGSCASGVCTCGGGATGADCTEVVCPGGCNGNGQCDTSTGTCSCGRGWTGPACLVSQAPPTTIKILTNKHIYDTGINDGLFYGLLVLAYFIGCFCALFCGGFLGAKIMQRKRDAQFSR